MAGFDGAGRHRVSSLQAGTISPAAKTWIWKLPSVASDTYFDKRRHRRRSYRETFGNDDVKRQVTFGLLWAMAGAASVAVAAAAPTPLCRPS